MQLGEDSFNELGFVDSDGHLITMLEARTFHASEEAENDSFCGSWFELTLPVRDALRAARFWAPIAPTLLDLAGLSPMAAATGLSMVPAFDSIEGVDRDFTVSELAHEDGPKLMAVRGRDWKILLNPKTRSIKGFWDLGEDPEETRDLVATQPDRMASKMQLLERALATVSVDEELSGAPASDLPDNIRRELQSLGYLGASEVQTNRPVPSFEAVPNPIPACDGSGTGITTLSWAAPASVEVRVGSATGKLMAVGAPTGTATTGRWVRQGTRFVLLDRATKQPIAETTVALTFLGCD